MRKIINIVESVDFRPAQWETLSDGTRVIGYPKDTTRKVKKTCKWCNGTKIDMQSDAHEKMFGKPLPCDACDGTGETMEWEYDFPQMRVTYSNQEILSLITGKGDFGTGWIPPEDIPEVKRRLIKLINSDIIDYARDPSEQKGKTFVDKSEPIPQIKRGATIIDGGLSQDQIKAYGTKMLEILNWAQQHGTGACWA